MRVTFSILLSALLAFPNFAQSDKAASQTAPQEQKPAQPAEQTPPPLKQPLAFGLEDGTPVKLRLTRNLSSADAKTGDRVDFEVLEDVRVKELLIIPRGGIAWATVTEAQAKRRMARGGKLNVNIDDVRLTDGEKVPLRAVKEAKGGGHTGAMTGAIVGTAIVFFPAAPLFLFMHGKDITIPKGTEITAYINGDIPLEQKRFLTGTTPAASSSDPAQAQAPVSGTQSANPQNSNVPDPVLSSVEVRSTPDGADITVDEKYMGNTPSTLKLTPGDHKVKLEKAGFKIWERTLTVNAGATATVNATLDKAD